MDKDTKEIRDAFKALGWNNRKISVKHRYCGYSDAIDITIKSFDVDIKKAEEIAKSKQSIRYDEYSGEPLLGANTYVNIEFDRDLLKNERMDIRYANIANKLRAMEMKIDHGKIIAETDKYRIFYFANCSSTHHGQIYIETVDNKMVEHGRYTVYHKEGLESILVELIRCRKLVDFENFNV